MASTAIRKLELNTIRRVILSIYGFAIAMIFIWVPWHGYEGPKERVNPTNLGYALVWSPPKPVSPYEVVSPETAAQASSAAHKSDGPPADKTGGVPDFIPESPLPYTASPETFSIEAYKTATIDYGRVGLEFGALTALLLIAWVSPRISPSK
jgi:hypothetical protein